ncbi:MAG TPA: site-specific integrase, partial [Urbifossiella sp.]|nr:site-specific integrase [Urbifossiella sp.]
MARPKNPVPVYSKHPIRDTARCWAGGKWIPLGRYDSPESRAAFRRVCAELAASGPAVAAGRARGSSVTLNEVLLAFIGHAEAFYVRPDGTQTNEVGEFKAALKVVRELYGHEPAANFGPLALKAVRNKMVSDLKWCRSRVNSQTRRVRRMFKWAASEELVPGSLVTDLKMVTGLRKNRSAAHETAEVKPAPEADYLATLPHVVPTIRAMLQLQRLGGLRPCEVRHLNPA